MARTHGHVSELEWTDLADEASRQLSKLMQLLSSVEEVYQGIEDLWSFHGDLDQTVANQLFNETLASAAQVAKATDLRAAVTAAHNAYVGADKAALRKLAPLGASRVG